MTIESLKPQRTCVGCKKRFDQEVLLAVTRLKNGEVVVNADRAMAGRSAYICKNTLCFKKAKDRKGSNGLQYTLKVQIPDAVWEELQKLI